MNLSESFPERVKSFIKAANKNKVNMILVGGGAVNFHGFQRHSADIDFWVELSKENIKNLILTLQELDYKLEDFPEKVKAGEQNISIKISPLFEIELITNFNPGKNFTQAFKDSVLVKKEGFTYHVLEFNDLIMSKITSNRTKDKLDIEELQKIKLRRKRN